MTATDTTTIDPAPAPRVHRFEVRTHDGQPDPIADRARLQADDKLPGCTAIAAAKVFLIEAPLTDAQAKQVADELLADPVNQSAKLGSAPAVEEARLLEVHFQPGVMDPVAESAADAVAEMFPHLDRDSIYVATGERYDITHPTADDTAITNFANAALANAVIQDVTLQPHHPSAFPHGHAYEFNLGHIQIRDLDDDALMVLSREGHLFLSLDEMHAVQQYYQDAGREPTDVELETLAQTWSEHCVHKTFRAKIDYTGPEGEKEQIDSILNTYIRAATESSAPGCLKNSAIGASRASRSSRRPATGATVSRASVQALPPASANSATVPME